MSKVHKNSLIKKESVAHALQKIDTEIDKDFKKVCRSQKSMKQKGEDMQESYKKSDKEFSKIIGKLTKIKQNSANYDQLKLAIQYRLNYYDTEAIRFSEYTSLIAIVCTILIGVITDFFDKEKTNFGFFALAFIIICVSLIALIFKKNKEAKKVIYYKTIMDIWESKKDSTCNFQSGPDRP